MTQSGKAPWLAIVVLGLVALIGWAVQQRLVEIDSQPKEKRQRGTKAVPVEVAKIERGTITLRRTFTGTLEASAEFMVAPKIAGRVQRLEVDLADTVSEGQIVATLDDAEHLQAVASAKADLEVARASQAEAESLLQIAERELERINQLMKRGVSSDSQRDAARAEQLAKGALVRVTRARVASAEAALAAAEIRLGYTQVTADWNDGGEKRLVAERFVDEGETVAANAPLLRIVELDPLTAVFFVTERDYARLSVGQSARLSTDAFPGETFAAELRRIAPVFRENTRQARVELRVANPDLRLKPGMFARATVDLEKVDDALIVPVQALTQRNGRNGVFLLSTDRSKVSWRTVEAGITEGPLLQIIPADNELAGEVVTLGQQLLDDGSEILIPGEKADPDEKPRKGKK